MPTPIVTVFGSAQPGEGEPAYRDAHALGRALAGEGWTLCNGGYGGTMEAAARGAVEAGGDTIGVTCGAFGRGGANRFIRREIPTNDLAERLAKLVELGRAYVVLPGGTGTLLELALVWELLNKKLIDQERPLVVLGDFWEPVLRTVGPQASGSACVHRASGIDQVVAVLRRHFSQVP